MKCAFFSDRIAGVDRNYVNWARVHYGSCDSAPPEVEPMHPSEPMQPMEPMEPVGPENPAETDPVLDDAGCACVATTVPKDSMLGGLALFLFGLLLRRRARRA